ncbi:MAG: GntR family transcriptional regulator, partial [Bauldia sp.]|nr:GntR family transcriptional regulator [Bauldia sp.]
MEIAATRTQSGASHDIAHEPISVRVRNRLLERILSGHYPPGMRLVELQLAREFGSSQAPVR